MKIALRYICVIVLLSSFPLSAQWTRTSLGTQKVGTVEILHDILSNSLMFARYYGLHQTTDDGETWTSIDPGVMGDGITNMAWDGYFLYASNRQIISLPRLHADSTGSTSSGSHKINNVPLGVWRTSNSGKSWTVSKAGLADSNIISLLAYSDKSMNSYVLASTYRGVFWSFDSAQTWKAVGGGIPDSVTALLACRRPDTRLLLFAVSPKQGIYSSTDAGLHWNAMNTGLPSSVFKGINSVIAYTGVSADILLFAATNTGIYRLKLGQSWEQVSTIPTLNLASSTPVYYQTYIAALTTTGNIYFTADEGASWRDITNGLGGWTNMSIALSDNSLFLARGAFGSDIGSYYDGVWKRSLSEITGIKDGLGKEIPLTYALEQNFPNPFNPSTTIRYSLPVAGTVILKVHDLLGKEVAVINCGEKPAGQHSVDFMASGLASGVYLYTLQSGAFSQTRKLVILK